MGLKGSNNQTKVFSRKLAKTIALGFLLVEIQMTLLFGAEFYVAPNGVPTGNGSLEQPWNLQTALNHPTNLVAGDTIWLRGGIYREANRVTLFQSALSGEPGLPITVRQWPGERATIDGNILQNSGGWVYYWGFEIMNSYPNRLTGESGSFPNAFKVAQGGQTNNLCVSGFDLRAPNVKLINLIVHDSIGGGLGVNSAAINPELYGVLSFYNGWQGCDRSHGHGIYIQSQEPSYFVGQENLFFANYALGVQGTSTTNLVDNYFLQGNVLFFNSVLARKHQGNLLLGPEAGQANNLNLYRNFVYDTHGSGSDVNIGYSAGANNSVLYDNYFQTRVHFSPSNQNLTLIMNSFLDGTAFLDQETFPDNSYPTNRPTNNLIEVRPSIFEPSRAHVIVYNWEGATNVAVDLSTVVVEGSEFEVRNAQDYFGAPVLIETFTGGLTQLPLTNLRVSKPVGSNAPPSTAPEFNVFVISAYINPAFNNVTNTAPTMSFVGNQSTTKNSATPVIPFTIFDAELPANYLTVSVSSSRPDLVPNPNIRFGGSGTNRTVSILPAQNAVGTTTVTIAISDGFLTASNVFTVAVNDAAASAQSSSSDGSSTITMQGNQALLRVYGPVETEYGVHTSTNLLHWSEIGKIFIDCSGFGLFLDSESLIFPKRFYRFSVDQHAPTDDFQRILRQK